MAQGPDAPVTTFMRQLGRPLQLTVVGLGIVVLGLGMAFAVFPTSPFAQDDPSLPGSSRWEVPVALVTMGVGLIVMAVAIQRRLRQAGQSWPERIESAALVALGAVGAMLSRIGFQPWDSARMFFNVLVAVALVGAGLVLMPRLPRRVIVSILVLFHFAGILCAVTSVQPRDQPAPWLSHTLWTRVYRPYLTFMYLTNAYHFYSPDPGPPSLLWFRIESKDNFALTKKSLDKLREAKVPDEVLAKLAPLKGRVFPTTAAFVEELAKVLDTEELERFQWPVIKQVEAGTKLVRWYKVPVRGEDPLMIHYQRFLALAESTNNPMAYAPLTELQKATYFKLTGEIWPQDSWENIYHRRELGGDRRVHMFVLTRSSLAALGQDLPVPVLAKLGPMKYTGLQTEQEFKGELGKLLSPEERASFQDRIMEKARRTVQLSVPTDTWASQQYSELQDLAKRLVASYAEHVARSEPRPVESVRAYRITHRIITPGQVASGTSPLHETFYVPYYLGKFDLDGQLLDPLDPFLYWYLPMVNVPQDYGREGGTGHLEIGRNAQEDDFVVNGLKIHSEDLLSPVRE
jgi:hypothetical protein